MPQLCGPWPTAISGFLTSTTLPPRSCLRRISRPKALALDDALAGGHASLALVRSFRFRSCRREKNLSERSNCGRRRRLIFGIASTWRVWDGLMKLWRKSNVLSNSIRFQQPRTRISPCPSFSPIGTIRDPAATTNGRIYPNYHQPHAFLGLAYEQKGNSTKRSRRWSGPMISTRNRRVGSIWTAFMRHPAEGGSPQSVKSVAPACPGNGIYRHINSRSFMPGWASVTRPFVGFKKWRKTARSGSPR